MRERRLVSLALVLLGALAIWEGVRVLVTQDTRGSRESGGYVVILGFLLVCLAAAHWLLAGSPGMEPGGPRPRSEGVHWVLMGFGILGAYAILIGYLGYLVSTLVFLVAFFRVFSPYRWGAVLIGSLLMSGGSTYFWTALGISLPRGILPWP